MILRKVTVIIATILIAVAEPRPAFAVEEHLITPDHPKATDISLDPGESFTGFFHASRSYECRVSQGLVPSSDDYLYFNPSVSGPGGPLNAAAVGAFYPAEAATVAATGRQALHRIAFIPTSTGSHTFALNFDGPQGSTGTVECYETTLTGGFNSFFASVPIVELRNRGSSAVTATVRAFDFTGTQVDLKSAVVPPSSRADIILAVPAQRYGKVLVTYLAPRESIEAIVAEYDFGASGSITLRRERPMTLTPIIP